MRTSYYCTVAKNKRIARERAAADAQRIEAERRADQMAGVRTNAAIVAVLVVVYFVRGGTFTGLGQLLALAICWLLAQIGVDLFRIYKNEAEPVGLVARFLPTLIIALLLFGAVFLTLG